MHEINKQTINKFGVFQYLVFWLLLYRFEYDNNHSCPVEGQGHFEGKKMQLGLHKFESRYPAK